MEIQDQILMKTYQNNIICLTSVIIYRKRSHILILELIENPLIFGFRIAYIGYAPRVLELRALSSWEL